MASMRDIKRRIKSVKSICQITRAMKMVAAAKLNRAQSRMLAMRPYAHEIERMLLRVLPELSSIDHPLLHQKNNPKKFGVLVISSDRGLCGGFNSNLMRKVASYSASIAGKEAHYMAVGKKAGAYCRRQGLDLISGYSDIMNDLDYGLADKISDKLNREFCDGNIDTLYLIYNEFKSAMSQNIVVRKLLPFDIVHLKQLVPPEDRVHDEGADVFEYEPEDTAEFAQLLLPRYLSTMIYRALLESYASELSARMAAMGNATKNADDMIFSLTLNYNKVRQSAITTEILEIVGGAEALKG